MTPIQNWIKRKIFEQKLKYIWISSRESWQRGRILCTIHLQHKVLCGIVCVADQIKYCLLCQIELKGLPPKQKSNQSSVYINIDSIL
jgi:hypothetical protein